MFKDSKKVLLSLGAVAAIGTAGVGGTFAAFSDSQSTGNNSFSAGTLTLDLAQSTLTNPGALAIGDAWTDSLVVKNTGSIKVKQLTLTPSAGTQAIDPALGDAVTVGVFDGSTQIGTTKTLNALNSGGSFNLDTTSTSASSALLGGAQHTYTVVFSLAGTTNNANDNTLQGLKGSEKFTIAGVQRDGAVRTASTVIDLGS